MSFVLGMDCELLVGSTVVDVAKSVTIDAETATADVTTRGNGGFKVEVPTLKTVKMSFELVYDAVNAAFAAIKAAYDAGTPLAMTAGDYSGNCTSPSSRAPSRSRTP